ncbi:MAG: RelA/SpoT domain-containing protein [bacterium]
MEKEAFLNKYNIEKGDFDKTGLDFIKLNHLKNQYEEKYNKLRNAAQFLINNFYDAPKVHSVRYRIKNPEHLVAKIIRKKIEDTELQIDINNYEEVITDLIGLRIMHLFKEDWEKIHDFIVNNQNMAEKPVAYIRDGDSLDYINSFKNKGCDVKEHPYGYRSVHYLLKIQNGKQFHFAEIQVRTIFEEAWSEIDHKVRYPYNLDNHLLSHFLVLFNRLAGSADEMGSYVRYLNEQLAMQEEKQKHALARKEEIIQELKKKISESMNEPELISGLENELDKIKAINEEDKENNEINIPDLSGLKLPYQNKPSD